MKHTQWRKSNVACVRVHICVRDKKTTLGGICGGRSEPIAGFPQQNTHAFRVRDLRGAFKGEFLLSITHTHTHGGGDTNFSSAHFLRAGVPLSMRVRKSF